jgi:hypothetical protein
MKDCALVFDLSHRKSQLDPNRVSLEIHIVTPVDRIWMITESLKCTQLLFSPVNNIAKSN